ncbi:hypothetical protein theurythT_08850 [Thalassotalea eurytherma]|uniref:HDOD domain-containing protein n=2 Tax=Thalassotalea eurytherma TaxID=1144278 RepID=A0ABQ6GZR6_9GAMM|nr:hypothetical protein theurythT_08850 [Thalassotalea eurytherma]
MNMESLLVTKQVYELLSKTPLPATLTIEQCAQALAMSMTSFRRKLANEDTSYKLIQGKYLNELCLSELTSNEIKVDVLACKLGYSERATFERAFKQKFGITPSQYRDLATLTDTTKQTLSLKQIIEALPPMPQSCKELIRLRDSSQLDLPKVVAIVEQDPIFSGRILGQASRAIYGKTPDTLTEAISRNLGVDNVVNFASLYAVCDALESVVDAQLIARYQQAFLLAPKFLNWFYQQGVLIKKTDHQLIEQVVVFGLIGVFLLNHRDIERPELILHALRGIDELSSLNRHMAETHGINVYAGSTLLLSQWHFDALVLKVLNLLSKQNTSAKKLPHRVKTIHFIIDCLYRCAALHPFDEAFLQQATLIGIKDIEGVKKIFK